MAHAPQLPSLDAWLAAELALVESQLQRSGPMCRLDRERAAPASLKELEGRYVVLRRAARLRERHASLQSLQAEADKAHAFLAADGGMARQAAWAAYFRGVLDAVRDVLSRSAEIDEGAHR